MTYVTKNFKTKKAVREAIEVGEKITCFEPGPFAEVPKNGVVYLEGPHYPEPHRWYGEGQMKDGFLVSIK